MISSLEDVLFTESIPSTSLQWPGATEEQLEFMKRVYDINLARSASRGTFRNDIPPEQLDEIEDGFVALRNTAVACRNLLAAARADIATHQVNVRIGLRSAYRSASHQFRLWQEYFPQYYLRTQEARAQSGTGPHSEEAAQLLGREIRRWIAIPGFGNHTTGIAIDFMNIENNQVIRNTSNANAIAAWRRSWFYNWLQQNAAIYGFKPYVEEPWHWEFRPAPDLERESKSFTESGCDVTENIADHVSFGNNTIENIIQPFGKGNTGLSIAETGGGTFQKIKKDQVRYIALEGGGGKGFVYIGALEALERLGILSYTSDGRLNPDGQIKGVSGASAGAITAMLISLGYNSAEIRRIMKYKFNRFFDLATIPRQIPSIAGTVVTSNETGLFSYLDIGGGIATAALGPAKDIMIKAVRSALASDNPESPPERKIFGHPLLYGESLMEDYGVFSGCHAYDFLNSLITGKTKLPRANFAQLYDLTRIKLVVTGTNLQSQNVEYFSVETTPNMPVAAAVRISMGLPIIFKPVYINKLMALALNNSALEGYWVDGGLKDNIPVKAFENEKDSKPHTLALRLENARPEPVLNIYDYIMAFVGTCINGEAQLSKTSGYYEQSIILSTGQLTTTNFNPPDTLTTPLTSSATQKVLSYFA